MIDEKQAEADLEWWQEVADAVDCVLCGFTYRLRASIYRPNYDVLIEIPGWFGETILKLKKRAEKE